MLKKKIYRSLILKNLSNQKLNESTESTTLKMRPWLLVLEDSIFRDVMYLIYYKFLAKVVTSLMCTSRGVHYEKKTFFRLTSFFLIKILIVLPLRLRLTYTSV